MKLLKELPPPSKSDKRWLAVSIIIFVGSLALVILAATGNNRNSPKTAVDINGNIIDPPQGTLLPGVAGANDLIKQMTAMPSAAPLTGPLADEVHEISKMVANCPDYNEARRSQMNQQISWLLQPNTLPKDMIIALGNNINGRLIAGMSTFTIAQWGLLQKAPTSCLLPIGKKLNDMLETNGEERFVEFDK